MTRDYKVLLQKYVNKSITKYRKENRLSQQEVSSMLRISPRSYIDQEHGKYGYSALSLMFYLSVLQDEQIVDFVRSFMLEVEEAERKIRLEHPLVYYRVDEKRIFDKLIANKEYAAK